MFLRRFFLFSFLVTLSAAMQAQNYLFGEGTVKWDLRKPYVMPPEAANYATSDLVILSDEVEFYFYTINSEKITRNIKYKVNTQKGLDDLKHYEMPESFDYGFDSELYKQSRQARIKIPQMTDYSVKIFAARKFSHERWSNVTVKDHYERLRWIKPSGEFGDEDMLILNLGTIAVGDVVEIYYEATFNSQYGNNIFYFNGRYPKLKCEYDFIYRVDRSFKDVSYILPVNIDAASTSSSSVGYDEHFLVTTRIQLQNLKANNFPLNSFESVKLPHVCADFSYYRSIVNYTNEHYSFMRLAKAKNFEWVIHLDTAYVDQTKIYDKQFGSIRKFISTLPPIGTDSQNVVFFRSFCDTLNNYRYISANHLFYNESNLYELYSADHLLKRRLPGHTLSKLYIDILKDNKLFFYLVNVQDKRFGEHSSKFHAHQWYEHKLVALPVNNSYIYFMPRFGGLKYHLNELPFYYEGTTAALTPMNFQPGTKDKETKIFRLIKTHRGTFNENARTESATVRIAMDSLTARLTIKESLSGQFSTILRHLYLNEFIDSTISPHYFKRCVDKPGAAEQKVKLSSKITEFPYRYNFNCSEKLTLAKDTTKLSLKNWFSFTLSKNVIPQTPNFDFYFDFDQSDAYNFSLDFNKPMEIKNREAFARKVDNDYFSLESEIVKNSEKNYLVKATLVVKQTSIPADKASLLSELVEQLDQLNNFTLELARN
jgi:hypothetical protein